MLRQIDPKISLVIGSKQLVKDFDGVHSIPAAYLFDGSGREVFRVGGDPGPPGRHHLNRRQLAREVQKLN